MQVPAKAEKKVEYLELIYDLIFVFVIGRNNLLLHNLSGVFIDIKMFIAYIVCTIAVIQIWSFTAYYINLFGRNGLREHIFLFINMFLMYFIAVGTNADYNGGYIQYRAAWALILLNIGLQYILELRNHKSNKPLTHQLKRMSLPLFTEAAVVIASIFAYKYAGLEISWLAILTGILSSIFVGTRANTVKVDFPHLTERAMLYVVFTFGEMIISLSGYFEGEFDINSLYFSAMGFLVAAGLFVSYETLYDNIVDREQQNNGLAYLFIHIFLVFALNNISAALEFMRRDEIALLPKMLFLICSFLIYYFCIFLLGRYAKKSCMFGKKHIMLMLISAAAFAVTMLVFREYMKINIFLTVIYGFSGALMLHKLRSE